MHGRRAFAAAAAAGLLVSLFAPWYRETVVAPGIHGLRTLTLTRSGWQAFSATELVVLAVAVLSLLVVIAMPRIDREDGAPDRRRLSGIVVAVLGTVAVVIVLARLTTAPGTSKHALAETMVAIRWGIFLALACSAALATAGLRLIRAPQPATQPAERSGRAERQTERASRRERGPRSAREPGSGQTPRQDRAPRPERTRPAADRPLWDEPTTGWLDLPD
jgi:MFS family permease